MELSEHSPYPPAMLIGLAAGLEPKYDVAARYGVDSRQLDKLMTQKGFLAALDKAKEVVGANGVDEEVVAFSLLQEITSRITKDLYLQYHKLHTTPDTQVKIANTLFARENQLRQRVHPNKTAATAQGSGFTININLPAMPNTPAQTVTIRGALPADDTDDTDDTDDPLDGEYEDTTLTDPDDPRRDAETTDGPSFADLDVPAYALG